MATIRGCPIPADLFAAWEQQLISELAPFFIPEALRSELPLSAPMLSRTAFRAHDWPLALVDSYRTYAVAPEAKWVALLSPAMFDALPAATQTALVQAQWRLGRGQVYPWAAVQRYLADWEDQSWMEARRAETNQGAVFLLDTAVWERLTPAARREWLRAFVQQQQPPYPTIALESVPSPIAGSVCLLANTFVASSGLNCFATTLAAASELAAAETIGAEWLHAAPFLDGIAAQGYRLQPGATTSPLLCDAVLLWRDAQGAPQHACYLIGDGIVLNKNSQAWYHPRELAALADVLAYWSDEPLELVVYTR